MLPCHRVRGHACFFWPSRSCRVTYFFSYCHYLRTHECVVCVCATLATKKPILRQQQVRDAQSRSEKRRATSLHPVLVLMTHGSIVILVTLAILCVCVSVWCTIAHDMIPMGGSLVVVDKVSGVYGSLLLRRPALLGDVLYTFLKPLSLSTLFVFSSF